MLRRQIRGAPPYLQDEELRFGTGASFALEPVQSRLSHVQWINYFNTFNPVSGHLDYYDVDANVEMPLPGPWGAVHNQHRDDRKVFYGDIARRL